MQNKRNGIVQMDSFIHSLLDVIVQVNVFIITFVLSTTDVGKIFRIYLDVQEISLYIGCSY